VREEIERHGTYEHTPEELAFGAQVTPVFHRYYDDADLQPSYVCHPEARDRALGEGVSG
jgi:nitric oxide synthase oxygenase domain/subunit